MKKPFRAKSAPRKADPTAKEKILAEWVRMAMVDMTMAICNRTSPNSKKGWDEKEPFAGPGEEGWEKAQE